MTTHPKDLKPGDTFTMEVIELEYDPNIGKEVTVKTVKKFKVINVTETKHGKLINSVEVLE